MCRVRCLGLLLLRSFPAVGKSFPGRRYLGVGEAVDILPFSATRHHCCMHSMPGRKHLRWEQSCLGSCTQAYSSSLPWGQTQRLQVISTMTLEQVNTLLSYLIKRIIKLLISFLYQSKLYLFRT